MTLIEELKKEIGEPKKSGTKIGRAYCLAMRDEIIEAKNAGYSLKVLVEILKKKSGMDIKSWQLHYVLYGKKIKSNKGYLLKYKIGNEEIEEWREFESKSEIIQYIELLSKNISRNKGYTCTGSLLEIKKMSRAMYEESNKQKRVT